MSTTTTPQLNVEIIDSDYAYSGFLNILKVRLRHSLFAGGMSPVITRELMERGQAVAVLLHDQQRDCVIMVEQFRIGAMNDPKGSWLLELVAGMIEEGEHPEQVARRESLEESGCEIKQLKQIGHYYVSPGGCTEQIVLYYAAIDSRGLDGTIAGVDHESEDIRVRAMPWADVERMLKTGEINNATTLIGLQWLHIQKLSHTL